MSLHYTCINNMTVHMSLLIYNFIFTRVYLCGAMTRVGVDHVPRSVVYVTSRVCQACNMIFHTCNMCDIPHNLHATIVHEIYTCEHMCIYGTAI